MSDLKPGETSSAGVANDVDAIFAPLQAGQPKVMHDARPGAATAGLSVDARVSQSRLIPRLGGVVAALLVAGTVGTVWMKPAWDERTRTAEAMALLAQPPRAPVARDAITLTTEPSRGMEIPTEFTYTPATRESVIAQPGPTPAALPRMAASSSGCRELAGQRRQSCFHAQVMSADRRLRQAYARAGDAGVPRPIMVSYRNRWAGLRREAIRDPSRVVAGYGAMAAELRREARQAERRYGRATG